MAKINYDHIAGSLPPGIAIVGNGTLGYFKTSIAWNDGTAPVWNTAIPSYMGSLDIDEAIVHSGFDVTPYTGRSITSYQVLGGFGSHRGALPFGIWLNGETGVLQGAPVNVGYDPYENPWELSEQPIWDAYAPVEGDAPDNQIADWATLDTVSTTIHATPQLGTSISSYYVVNGYIPWGITLNSVTGELSGVVSQNAATGTVLETQYPKPKWNTITGSLGNFGENKEVTLALSATAMLGTSITNWEVISGFLPWGLVLNSGTGTISGTTAAVVSDGDLESLTPIPTWNTTEGSLGNFDENSTVSISLSATPNLGTSNVTWEVINGALPWGLTMNASTGLISGTAANVDIDPLEPQYVYPGPTWVTESDLGSITVNTPVSRILEATPSAGRSLAFFNLPYKLTRGLPYGVWLSSTSGELSGTPIESGVFTFTVSVSDNTGATSTRQFTLTVT